MNISTRLKALSLVTFCALVCLAAELPRPRPGTFVHDFAGVIHEDREAEIQAKAQRLRDEYKTEIAVVTIDTLGGEESFDYSMRMARAWGIGSKENDVRGLLILVAVRDRKTAFRTSRHVEGELPDGVTGDISREMNAYFKQGDFGAGLSAGMDGILGRMKEVYETPPAAAASTPANGFGMKWLLLPIVGLPALGLGYAVLRRRARKNREAAQQSGTRSGFLKWATTKDPSAKPKPWHKSHEITRAGSRPAAGGKKNKKAAHGGGGASSYGSAYESPSYESSSSSSSSSYDSGSSSSSDSDSSYSGGSDFGGGGSDSSW